MPAAYSNDTQILCTSTAVVGHTKSKDDVSHCHYLDNTRGIVGRRFQHPDQTWLRQQMETFSALLAICAENSPVPGEFPTQRPVTRNFDVFFDLRLIKQLSKQSRGWSFETLSHPLWRHRNEYLQVQVLTSMWVSNIGFYSQTRCHLNGIEIPIMNLRQSDDLWWRHQMETFSALLAICAGNSSVSGKFPAQRLVTRSFDVFFDLCPNKRLSKQTWGRWFETTLCSLWRHSNAAQFLIGLTIK